MQALKSGSCQNDEFTSLRQNSGDLLASFARHVPVALLFPLLFSKKMARVGQSRWQEGVPDTHKRPLWCLFVPVPSGNRQPLSPQRSCHCPPSLAVPTYYVFCTLLTGCLTFFFVFFLSFFCLFCQPCPVDRRFQPNEREEFGKRRCSVFCWSGSSDKHEKKEGIDQGRKVSLRQTPHSRYKDTKIHQIHQKHR